MYICVTDDMQSSSTVATLGVLWTQHAILSTRSSAPRVPSGEMSLACLVQLLGPWTFRKGLPLFLGGWWRRVVGEAGASTSRMVLGREGLSSAGDHCGTGRGSSHLFKWQKCMPTGTLAIHGCTSGILTMQSYFPWALRQLPPSLPLPSHSLPSSENRTECSSQAPAHQPLQGPLKCVCVCNALLREEKERKGVTCLFYKGEQNNEAE